MANLLKLKIAANQTKVGVQRTSDVVHASSALAN